MRALLPCVIASTLLASAPAAAQDLGHRLVGTQGLYAGRQREPGLYVADQLAYYGADTLRDRDGELVPVDDLRIDAIGNALGLSLVLEIPGASTFVTMTAAVPLASASISSERPEASVDRAGLGDVFLQPFLFGWRLPHVDVVAGYSVYLPTGIFRLGEGNLSRGHVTHQLSRWPRRSRRRRAGSCAPSTGPRSPRRPPWSPTPPPDGNTTAGALPRPGRPPAHQIPRAKRASTILGARSRESKR